jgi:hypothetical protein
MTSSWDRLTALDRERSHVSGESLRHLTEIARTSIDGGDSSTESIARRIVELSVNPQF